MQLTVNDVREVIKMARERGEQPDLSRRDLSNMQFFKADLQGVNLSRADLTGANLTRADLNQANLNGADLSGANFLSRWRK